MPNDERIYDTLFKAQQAYDGHIEMDTEVAHKYPTIQEFLAAFAPHLLSAFNQPDGHETIEYDEMDE